MNLSFKMVTEKYKCLLLISIEWARLHKFVCHFGGSTFWMKEDTKSQRLRTAEIANCNVNWKVRMISFYVQTPWYFAWKTEFICWYKLHNIYSTPHWNTGAAVCQHLLICGFCKNGFLRAVGIWPWIRPEKAASPTSYYVKLFDLHRD